MSNSQAVTDCHREDLGNEETPPTPWEEVLAMQPGHVAADYQADGVRVLIMRGYGALCGYFGVPEGHPLAGLDFELLPVGVHGGFNFGGKGGEDRYHMNRPLGYYWYGWTYDHSGDYTTDYDVLPTSDCPGGKQWTVEDVKRDIAWSVLSFEKLVKLVEEVALRSLGWRGRETEQGLTVKSFLWLNNMYDKTHQYIAPDLRAELARRLTVELSEI